MDLRRAFFSRAMKLIRHPTVERALADPLAMDLFVAAVRGKTRIAATLSEARRRLQRRW